MPCCRQAHTCKVATLALCLGTLSPSQSGLGFCLLICFVGLFLKLPWFSGLRAECALQAPGTSEPQVSAVELLQALPLPSCHPTVQISSLFFFRMPHTLLDSPCCHTVVATVIGNATVSPHRGRA